MRKITLLALAGAAFVVPAASSPTPAQAFCTAYTAELGCVNEAPCAAYAAVRDHASPYGKLPEMYCLL
jgi:hypothetical protein